jgi:hypothetical protein
MLLGAPIPNSAVAKRVRVSKHAKAKQPPTDKSPK